MYLTKNRHYSLPNNQSKNQKYQLKRALMVPGGRELRCTMKKNPEWSAELHSYLAGNGIYMPKLLHDTV